jgi:hypothetical protein
MTLVLKVAYPYQFHVREAKVPTNAAPVRAETRPELDIEKALSHLHDSQREPRALSHKPFILLADAGGEFLFHFASTRSPYKGESSGRKSGRLQVVTRVMTLPINSRCNIYWIARWAERL